ncbi:MAG: phosphatidylserine decarboxylase [Candidatus Pelagibacter sp. TMED64]|nr:phosphatidylserine decarboxylase family protein [Candidatus Pelagibacter sp.]OUU67899.1 MAG: phosphatidylserine decarboxylase [Candidatus Pelagibacter sp. TMED64]|tara:strand:+ start:4509 stop:5171 length:663 start_codon:yes stop_codon:yes gene_type:complete
MIETIFPKIHKEGYRFLVIAVSITLILLFISKFLATVSFIISVWVYYFFRDPDRYSINDDNYVVSPADGVITSIAEVNGPTELNLGEKKFTRISIFMNVFNCHVNRIPLDGQIEKIVYMPGKFFNASLDKASEENERNLIKFKTKNNDEVIIVQIAGLIARRIVCETYENQTMKQGERIGIIRFGSRVDLYLQNFKILSKINQTTTAGETILAKKNIPND